MRVLDWVGFIYALGSLLIFTYNLATLIFNWHVPKFISMDSHVDTLGFAVLFMPIFYSVFLILQYIIRDKVRILPWK